MTVIYNLCRQVFLDSMWSHLLPPLDDIGHGLVVGELDLAVEDDVVARVRGDVVRVRRARGKPGDCKKENNKRWRIVKVRLSGYCTVR